MAMGQKAQEAVEKVDSGCELFRIAKQSVWEKKDVVGVSCLKDESGAVKVSVDDQKEIWKEHMEKLMNVENGVIALMLVRLRVLLKELN